MLNRENRMILKTLQGEYRKFAKKLSSSAFLRCEDSRSINEHLAEMFAMLKIAQEEGKPFQEVIPEPETTVREILLCFPPKHIWRIALIWCFTALFIISAAVGGALLYRNRIGPIPLEKVTFSYYFSERNELCWNEVPHATQYEVFLQQRDSDDYEKIGETTFNCLPFKEAEVLQERNGKYYVRILAKGEGRYQDSTATLTVESDLPTVRGGIADFVPDRPLGSLIVQAHCNSHRFLNKVVLTPEYNFYGCVNYPNFVYGMYVRSEKAVESNLEEYESVSPEAARLFRAGEEYTFFIRQEDLFLSAVRLLDYLDEPLLPGKTIFAVCTPSAGEHTFAYVSDNENVKFAVAEGIPGTSFNSSYIVESQYLPSVCGLDMRNGGAASKNALYHIAENSGAETSLTLKENAIERNTESFRETLTLQPGYVTLRILPSEEVGTDWSFSTWNHFSFNLYAKKRVEIVHFSTASFELYYETIKPAYEGLNGALYWDWDASTRTEEKCFTLYVSERTELVIEGQELGNPFYNNIQLEGTLRLKPGLTAVRQLGHYTMLKSDSLFSISNQLTSLQKNWMLTAYDPNVSYLAYLFNPYDYEIEVTVTELTTEALKSN